MNSGQYLTPGWAFHSWYHHCCPFHHVNGITTSDNLRLSNFDMSGEKCLEPGAVIPLLIFKVHDPNHYAHCLFYFGFKGPTTFKILNFPLPLGERASKQNYPPCFFFFHPRHISEYFDHICHFSCSTSACKATIHSIKWVNENEVQLICILSEMFAHRHFPFQS